MRRFIDYIVATYGNVDNGAEKVFAKYDTNKSGVLTREEFLYALDQIDDVAQLNED